MVSLDASCCFILLVISLIFIDFLKFLKVFRHCSQDVCRFPCTFLYFHCFFIVFVGLSLRFVVFWCFSLFFGMILIKVWMFGLMFSWFLRDFYWFSSVFDVFAWNCRHCHVVWARLGGGGSKEMNLWCIQFWQDMALKRRHIIEHCPPTLY